MKKDKILLTPFKGKDRKSTVALTCLFAIKIANDYLAQNKEQSIRRYIEYLNDICKENCVKIKASGKVEEWNFMFAKDDIYEMRGMKAEVVKTFAIDKIVSANKFIKATVRMFWDSKKKEVDDLIKYLAWLTKHIKTI